MKQTLRRWFGVVTTEINQNEVKLDRVIELVGEQGRSQQTILQILKKLETSAMAKLKEILEAQEKGGKIIIDGLTAVANLTTTIAAETADVATTIGQIKNGTVPLSELDGVLAAINSGNAKIQQVTDGIVKASDSVKAIVPTIITPEVPTPTPAPSPAPIPTPPIEVVPAPVQPTEVVIEKTPSDVGFPEVPSIDVTV